MSTQQNDNEKEQEQEQDSLSTSTSEQDSSSMSDGELDYDTNEDCNLVDENDIDDVEKNDYFYDDECAKYCADHVYIAHITSHLTWASKCVLEESDLEAVESVCAAMKIPFVTADNFIALAVRFRLVGMVTFYSNRSVGKSNVKATEPFNTWRNHVLCAYKHLNTLTWLRSCPYKLDRLRRHALKVKTDYEEFNLSRESHLKRLPKVLRYTTCSPLQWLEHTCGCTKVVMRQSHEWVRCERHASLCAEYEATVRNFDAYCASVITEVNRVQLETTRQFRLTNKNKCSLEPGDIPSSPISIASIVATVSQLPNEFNDHLDPRFEELRNLVPVDHATDPKPSIYPWNNRIRYERARTEYMSVVGLQDAMYVMDDDDF